VYCCDPAVVFDVADVAAAIVISAVRSFEPELNATLVVGTAANAAVTVWVGSARPSASRIVTRTVAFSPGL